MVKGTFSYMHKQAKVPLMHLPYFSLLSTNIHGKKLTTRTLITIKSIIDSRVSNKKDIAIISTLNSCIMSQKQLFPTAGVNNSPLSR